MRRFRHAFLLLTLPFCTQAFAQETAARQPHEALRQAAQQFLQAQAAGLPGTVSITVGAVDPRLNLAACPSPEAFFPPGSRAWGKTTVGVRCTAPTRWSLFLTATVRVTGEYVAAAAPLAQGQSVTPNDLVKASGDLTALPAGVVTDAAQAVGRTLTLSVPAGAPLRQEALRAQQAIRQGQAVRVMSSGQGFQVSVEARALNNAAEGQVAQARTQSGQVVSGIARAGGLIEVVY